MQEMYPSGEENGSAVTIGEYVRDVFLEQVSLQFKLISTGWST